MPLSPFLEAQRDSTIERRNSTPVITSATVVGSTINLIGTAVANGTVTIYYGGSALGTTLAAISATIGRHGGIVDFQIFVTHAVFSMVVVFVATTRS